MEKTKRGKGMKLMVVADRSGLPVSVHAAGASPHEVTLVWATLDAIFEEDKPERLIRDEPTTRTRSMHSSKLKVAR